MTDAQSATDAIREYEQAAVAALQDAGDAAGLEQVRITFLGKKKGRLKDLQSLMGSIPNEEKRAFGQAFNEVKNRVEGLLADRKAELERPAEAGDAIDVTLPGVPLRVGSRHPVSQTIAEFKEIMARFGFDAVEGPEIEDERHNFEALNIPESHPARDPLDNFYLAVAGKSGQFAGQGDQPLLLRSQTSTVQIRQMENQPPPVRVVSLGRVYRPDSIDATHHCMFHQMEGLMVGPDVTMANLKTVLSQFAKAYLGDDVTIRFRPSFFPFTEPSVEVDLHWPGMQGDYPWLELGGAGMVDPAVLTAVGYDPEDVTGFAFGLGIERFAMFRYGITDIRRLTENDVRFLRQF